MCYHVSTPSQLELVEQLPDYSIEAEFTPYYHVSGFERPFLPVTTNANPQLIERARWKLLPFWVKTEDEAKKYANTLNAHCDEIFVKKSYTPFIGKRHGLLWVTGFYEPHKVEGVKETENFYVYHPAKEIFSLGVVYAPWKDKETQVGYNTFTILTVDANPMMAEIHNEKLRMPLVIPPNLRSNWLNASAEEEVKSFFKPYEGELKAHKIGVRVTAARGIDTNVPETQLPFA